MTSAQSIALSVTAPDEAGNYEIVIENRSDQPVCVRPVYFVKEVHVADSTGREVQPAMFPLAVSCPMWRLGPQESRQAKHNIFSEFNVRAAGEYEIWVDFDNQMAPGEIRHPHPALDQFRFVTGRVKFEVKHSH